jgi:hypothetical protein
MKRFFLFLIAVAIMPALAFGQSSMKITMPLPVQKMAPVKADPSIQISPELLKTQYKQLPESKGHGVLLENAPSSYYASWSLYLNYMSAGNNGFAYDPTANVLLFARTLYAYSDIKNSTGNRVTQIWIHRSFDRGATWDSIPYISTDTNLYFSKTDISVANPYHTTNFDSIFVFVSASEGNIVNGYIESNGLFCLRLFNKAFTTYETVLSAIKNAKWDDVRSVYGLSTVDTTLNFLVYGQPLYEQGSTIRTDLYLGLLINGCKGTTIPTTKKNIVPSSWNIASFYPTAADVKTGYVYESRPVCATGDDGTIYSMFDNIPVDDTTTTRRPCLSKSTDAGVTWSALDWCPATALVDGLKTTHPGLEGLYDINFWWNKPTDDLVVLGNDEFSYMQRKLSYWITEKDGVFDTTSYHVIIEIRKQGNLWSATPVTQMDLQKLQGEEYGFIGHDFNYVPANADRYSTGPSFLYRYTDQTEGTQYDTMVTTPRECELQMSKTPNGDLVAKWIDFTGELDTIPAQVLYNSPDELTFTTLAKTDVYMSYRKYGETSWSTPVRIFENEPDFTKRSTFYPKRGTYMPRVIPSINEVPLMDIVFDTIKPGSNGLYDARYLYPMPLRESEVDQIGLNFFVYHKIALDSNIIISVNENPTIDLKSTVGNVYPNPCSDRMEFSININKPANVNVEIFNMTGEKVATVYNGYVSSLSNAISYNDVKNLQSGAYYCVVTIDGTKTTKKFTVAR